MDEHKQGVATNGARAESTSEQGWGKDAFQSDAIDQIPPASKTAALKEADARKVLA